MKKNYRPNPGQKFISTGVLSSAVIGDQILQLDTSFPAAPAADGVTDGTNPTAVRSLNIGEEPLLNVTRAAHATQSLSTELDWCHSAMETVRH